MEHQDDHIELTAEDALHASLCALALGELAGDERAALEARIAADAALAEQYQEVAETIALVRTSFAAPEALPAAHLERVLAGARSAAHETPIYHLAWYRQPAVKLAASLVLLAGAGFVGLKLMRPADVVDGDVARVDGGALVVRERARELNEAAPGGGPASVPADSAETTLGFDLERAANGAGKPYLRAFTEGEIRQNGQSKYVDPDTGTQANGGLNLAAGPPVSVGASVALGGSVDEALKGAPEPSLRYAGAGGPTGSLDWAVQEDGGRSLEALTSVQDALKAVDPANGAAVYHLEATGARHELQLGTMLSADQAAVQAGLGYGGGAGNAAPEAATAIPRLTQAVDTTKAADPGSVGNAGGGGGRGSFLTRQDQAAGPSSPGPAGPGAAPPAGPVGGAYSGPGAAQPPASPGSPGAPAAPARGGEIRARSKSSPETAPQPSPTPLDRKAPDAGVAGADKDAGKLAGGEAAGSDEFFLGGGRAPKKAADGAEAAQPEAKDARLADGRRAEALGEKLADLPAAESRVPASPAPAERPDDAQDEMQRRLRGYYDDYDVEAGRNPRYSEEQLRVLVDDAWQRIHRECQPRPNERPRDMYFRFWGDNAFVRTAGDPLSTFAADVDTASYALARRYLREGRTPERAQIRTEEFVNAFTPDLAPPSEGTFALSMELAPTPFGEDANHWLLRVGVRGKEVAKDQREPLNLTFVVDTSGSMREQNRLELVKHAMRLLVTQLDARDTIAVVAYSNEARQILGPTSAAHRDLIESAIFPLQPNGSTNADAGLKMGYALAETMLRPGTHNRVVFLSDGVANMGQTDQDRINQDVKRLRDAGIYLNTIGVGMNNHNDVFLEQLADKGDGICDYVDDAAAAEKAIVERFTGAFVPIASDVKLQVEFDPRQVLRWRQLGYENRAIADQDFRNDKVDAGEVGAGHQVVCLYEVELAPEAEHFEAARSLATLRVRWKAPKVARQDANEVDVFERETGLELAAAKASFRAASSGFRRSALAAQLAEVLRRSTHARTDSYAALVAELGALLDETPRPGRASVPGYDELVELADLVRRADGLGFGRELPVSELERTLEAYRRFQYLRASLREVERQQAEDTQQLEDMNRRLEEQLRDALMRDLRQRHG